MQQSNLMLLSLAIVVFEESTLSLAASDIRVQPPVIYQIQAWSELWTLFRFPKVIFDSSSQLRSQIVAGNMEPPTLYLF